MTRALARSDHIVVRSSATAITRMSDTLLSNTLLWNTLQTIVGAVCDVRFLDEFLARFHRDAVRRRRRRPHFRRPRSHRTFDLRVLACIGLPSTPLDFIHVPSSTCCDVHSSASRSHKSHYPIRPLGDRHHGARTTPLFFKPLFVDLTKHAVIRPQTGGLPYDLSARIHLSECPRMGRLAKLGLKNSIVA